MERFFKKAWDDSKKRLGACYFVFKDSLFSTEISKQQQYPGVIGKTVFRTIFIQNKDIKRTTAGDMYYELLHIMTTTKNMLQQRIISIVATENGFHQSF